MKTFRTWDMLVVLMLIPAVAQGAAGTVSITTEMLDQPSSTRAESMGGAQAAVSTDEAGASGWNPAGLEARYPLELSAAYFHELENPDKLCGAFHFCAPAGENMFLGGSATFFDAGQYNLKTSDGRDAFAAANHDFTATLTSAARLNHAAYGLNVKVLYRTMDDSNYAFLAADIGARWELNEILENLSLGFSLKNVGGYLQSKPDNESNQATEYALSGLAYKLWQEEQFEVLIAGDTRCDLEATWRENIGFEVWIAHTIALRGGRQFGYDERAGNLGLGLKMANLQLDYDFSLLTAASSVQRLSLTYSFGDTLPRHAEHAGADPASTASDQEYKPKAAAIIRKRPSATIYKRVTAEVVAIQRIGAHVAYVSLNVGSKQQIQPGFKGIIVNSSGLAIAGIHIWEVFPEYSFAEVVALSRDLDRKNWAVIDVVHRRGKVK